MPLVTPSLMDTLRTARKTLQLCREPQANELACRCDKLLHGIQRGRYATHCEISNELRSIIDEVEGLLKT